MFQGKFIRINFDASGFIAGANIETYLLEKSRAIRQAKDERTFHIFYQILAGATPQQRAEYILEDPKSYPFLSNAALPVPGIDDALEFQATIKSMNIMGMNTEDFNSIFRIVSATLLFGSMQFKQERNSDQATLPDNTVAQKIAHLLGKNFGFDFKYIQILAGYEYSAHTLSLLGKVLLPSLMLFVISFLF